MESNETIRPFRYHAPQADLDDIKRRIPATKWPEKEPVADSSPGVPLATIRKLARYWAEEYGWRKIKSGQNRKLTEKLWKLKKSQKRNQST